MKTFLAPRVVVPLVVGLVLLGVLLSSADVGRVLRVVSGFHPRFVLFLLALTGLYEVLRVVQWFLLLRVLDRQAPGRVALMAYMGGEVAKALPGGQYFQTYLLRQAQGVPMARSAAATTLILWLEVVVSLLVVLVLGVGAWPWLRPACLLLLGGLALLALLHRPLTTAAARLARRHPQAQAAGPGGRALRPARRPCCGPRCCCPRPGSASATCCAGP